MGIQHVIMRPSDAKSNPYSLCPAPKLAAFLAAPHIVIMEMKLRYILRLNDEVFSGLGFELTTLLWPCHLSARGFLMSCSVKGPLKQMVSMLKVLFLFGHDFDH